MDSVPRLQVVTIQRGYNIPSLQMCSNCCDPPSYHCPFCLPLYFQPTTYSRTKFHLVNHLKRAVYVGEYAIHRCGLECRAGTHYHCPFCSATRVRRVDFISHLSRDHQQRARTTPTVHSTKKQKVQTKGSPTPGEDDMETVDNCGDDGDKETIISDSEDKNSQGASSSSSQLQTILEKPRDCDDQYFMSLVKLFKKLPPQKMAEVRLKIERLLLEAEFQ